MTDPVVRIASRGEGQTERGVYVPFGLPGDLLRDDGTLQKGPGHQVPPCRHFPECGGCQLQHANDSAYRAYVESRIVGALAEQGLSTDVREARLSPPRSRRRATLRLLRGRRGVQAGFSAARSNLIVDMRECHILRPELFALVGPLRGLAEKIMPMARSGRAHLTLCDQGVDLLLSHMSEPEGLAAVEALTDFAIDHGLARLSLDSGLGPETRFEPAPATVTFAGRRVALPHNAFLQATEEGEGALVAAVREAIGEATVTADLFAGLGTFALALPGRVYAAEASRDAMLALKAAAPEIAVEHRDLYRCPLDQDEVSQFDALVLDPPRAGAWEQVRQIAGSRIGRVAYVSCNPPTFARDAKALVDAGFRLDWVTPVGQFLWSTHVELAAAFSR